MSRENNNIKTGGCFFTWDIHYACNYRCSYCYFHETWEEEARKNRYPGLDKWKEIWGSIYERYGEAHIHISGGEPFTYPDFIGLVEYLTGRFTVEFDTNLFFDVEDFMKRIGPDRVKFATAFHPQFADFEVYIKKLLKLKKAGYDLGVNYVAFPEQLEKITVYKQRLSEVYISFDIMPFRGKYEGREYPQGYTPEEKEKIRNCDPGTAEKMLDAYGDNGSDEESPKPLNPHKGKLCRMGQKYAKIHSNGNAYRCCLIKEKGYIGNLIDGTFALFDEPAACDLDKCPCWVAMIVGEEKNWDFHWVTPHSFRQET